MKDKFQMSSMRELTFFLGLRVKQKKDGIFISQDKYVAEILKKFRLSEGKSASTPIDAEKPLLKDSDGEDVDVHTYRSMVGSLMYLTSSRPDIMFAGKPYLGLWYPKDSPFDLVAYSDSDYASASLDIKSTTGGCQFLGCGLISWQCNKQTVVATSATKAKYVAAASGCCYLRNMVIEISVLNILSDALPITTNGVNTPKSDEDRIKLLELMVFLLQQGFWNTAFVKRSDDVTRLQALVDKKKIVISEDVIREILQLDDAEGMVCLPNEDIFAGLAQMGYEKPSTKLNFYKAFFSSQWKFLIHTLLQSLSTKKTSWNEFSSAMASALEFYMYPRFIQLTIQNQIGDLSTNTTRYISFALTQKVFANMRRIGKGFSRVETPLFAGMLAAREITEEGIAEEQVQADNAVAAAVQETVAEDVANEAIPSTPLILSSPPSHEQSSPPQQPQSSTQAPLQGAKFLTYLFQQVLDTCSALTHRVESLEHDKATQKLAIIKLQARRIESSDDMKDVFNQGRMIDNLDQDEGIELVVDQVKDTDTDETEGRHATKQAKKQAKIYHLDLDHPSKVLNMQEDDSEVHEVVEPSIPAAAPTVVAAYTRRRKGVIIKDPGEELSSKTPVETPKLKDKGKGILIETPKPMKKKDQIELDAEYARKLHKEINKDHEEINKDINWDAAIDHVNKKSMGNQYIKRYHGMKKRPQTESEARKNMMTYLKNTDGYKLDFFKEMSYDEIRPIFQARFDANMRFLLNSIEEMEEEDREILKSINETPTQKATKRRKLNKEAQEVEDLKKHLEVVNDEDDDVLTEATPLGRKVPVVDYQIVVINNKPRFKIIKADETHQLYISFITLLKNFDRGDLEDL
nr:uncharacterized mitochondrial protein AtMg00810-like [Tanacetum cinerariifolium]